MAKIVLSDVENVNSSKAALNSNFEKIEQEFQNRVLYRDNPTGEPNTMSNDLDMDSNDLLNVGEILSQNISSDSIDSQSINTNTLTINNKSLEDYIIEDLAQISINNSWGSIEGTLSNQTDLQNALDSKVNTVSGKQLSTEDYTTTEKNKLAGIASGATANSTDAQLRDRSTHTGTQAISTITDLQTALDLRNVSIVVGTPITLTGTSVTFTAPANTVFGIIPVVGMSTNGLSPAMLQLGDAGGYEATGYSSSAAYAAGASAITNGAQSTGLAITPATTAATSYNLTLILTRSNLSTNTWSLSVGGGSFVGAALSNFGGGTKSLSEALTGGRFIMVNGTDSFDAGYFNTIWVVQNV